MNDAIPNRDHVARYCPPKHCDEDRIHAGAFMIREHETGLSVNWVEYLNCPTRNDRMLTLRELYSRKLRVGSNARIAILNVGDARQYVINYSDDRRNLSFVHSPTLNDPSHAEIVNLKPDDELIAELICEKIQEHFPARNK